MCGGGNRQRLTSGGPTINASYKKRGNGEEIFKEITQRNTAFQY